MFNKVGVFINFTKFTRKHLCFNVPNTTLLKRDNRTVSSEIFFESTFITEIIQVTASVALKFVVKVLEKHP